MRAYKTFIWRVINNEKEGKALYPTAKEEMTPNLRNEWSRGEKGRVGGEGGVGGGGGGRVGRLSVSRRGVRGLPEENIVLGWCWGRAVYCGGGMEGEYEFV